MPTPQDIASSFIEYLKEQGRSDELPLIVEALQKEVFRNQDVTVITAETLPDTDRHELEKKLNAKWGEHRILFSQDPTLISGMLIRFGNEVIDLSGRTRLTDLREHLESN